jgi:hypothetical protein
MATIGQQASTPKRRHERLTVFWTPDAVIMLKSADGARASFGAAGTMATSADPAQLDPDSRTVMLPNVIGRRRGFESPVFLTGLDHWPRADYALAEPVGRAHASMNGTLKDTIRPGTIQIAPRRSGGTIAGPLQADVALLREEIAEMRVDRILER